MKTKPAEILPELSAVARVATTSPDALTRAMAGQALVTSASKLLESLAETNAKLLAVIEALGVVVEVGTVALGQLDSDASSSVPFARALNSARMEVARLRGAK